ncbi:hypothetical protein VHUM_02189 [Vanrija humicola]|uniref:Phosphatidic acid phosphatase type 2/haloperoxidase domain-containing protein n=1 Tax=Vanrija humicola TaxID=5417 RepID=A0A7D8ZPM1_VANHU|nr:hypothetical protein VHUM_02189 [Vanrija humicola]
MGLLRPHKPSEYPSFLLYFLDQTHVTVTVGTAGTILYTQSPHAVWFSLGAVASTLMAKVAKKLIREPRPDSPPPDSNKTAPVKSKQTYGMPSSHSTALSYYFFYLFPLLPLATSSAWGERAVLTAVCALTIWSRVELGYHTVAQVLGGGVVGAVGAVTWSTLWNSVPAIETTLQSAISWTRDLVWPM